MRQSDTQNLVRVTVSADPVETSGMDYRKSKYDLLRTLADSPELTQLQGHDFQKMVLSFCGDRWIAELSAVVPVQGK